jgi:hypothetical protein
MRYVLFVMPLIVTSPVFAHVGNHSHLSSIEVFGHAADMSHIGATVVAVALAVAATAVVRVVRLPVEATKLKGPSS